MPTNNLEERLARLEAQRVVADAMLVSVVKHLPSVDEVVADFRLHQEYLHAKGLHSAAASDEWLATLEAAREELLWRLGVDTDRTSPDSAQR